MCHAGRTGWPEPISSRNVAESVVPITVPRSCSLDSAPWVAAAVTATARRKTTMVEWPSEREEADSEWRLALTHQLAHRIVDGGDMMGRVERVPPSPNKIRQERRAEQCRPVSEERAMPQSHAAMLAVISLRPWVMSRPWREGIPAGHQKRFGSRIGDSTSGRGHGGTTRSAERWRKMRLPALIK